MVWDGRPCPWAQRSGQRQLRLCSVCSVYDGNAGKPRDKQSLLSLFGIHPQFWILQPNGANIWCCMICVLVWGRRGEGEIPGDECVGNTASKFLEALEKFAIASSSLFAGSGDCCPDQCGGGRAEWVEGRGAPREMQCCSPWCRWDHKRRRPEERSHQCTAHHSNRIWPEIFLNCSTAGHS